MHHSPMHNTTMLYRVSNNGFCTATVVATLQCSCISCFQQASIWRCRAAIKLRCKDLEPWLLREHTLALQRCLTKAAEEHEQIADTNMHELIAAEEKQLVTPGSKKKSQAKKKVGPALQVVYG